ncbi:hypothetical protein [Polaribacter sp. Z022]|uniref:hypothetical protein n=1 Tax=Polaribacter sp. Z022 TaxID=2927125 RepID=UPI00201FF7BB|nr:hypothetical protein [Polaribacter sp. Z022]MCL7754381.1 hypothetical protein [Polaribacter sp. Z022]
MKKITLLIIILFTITISAQTEKGKVFVGANSNFSFNSSKYTTTSTSSNYSSTYTSDPTNSFSFSPQVGYFISDNFVLGLNFRLSSTKVKGNESNGFYTISPFAKYYLLEGNLKPFLNASLGLGSFFNSYQNYIVDPNTSYYEKVSTKINSARIGGGLAYFLNDIIAFEFNLDYFNETYKSDNNQNSNTTKQTHSGIQSTIGIALFL